jgi:NADH-quinone oxidoreductase subunit G
VDLKKADFDKAVENAAARILETLRVHGPQSVAFAGSGRSSVENNYALKMFAQTVGSENICFSANPVREAKDRLAASRLAPELRRSLKAVEDSDLIICVGADPVNEAPMLGLLMRQGVRKGARVITIDPRPVKLPFAHEHIPTAQDSLQETLRRVVEKEASNSKNIIIVCGTDITSPDDITSAAEIANGLKSSGKDAGLIYTMDEANSFGTALISTGKGFNDILEEIESGAVRVLVVMESDPLERYPDKDRLDKAINKLDWLFVMDYIATGTALKADILMPTTVFAEDDGVFVNNEGRAQAFGRAYIAGIPVNDMGPALHPPRVPSSTVPGRTMPAWWWCSEVAHIIDPAVGLPDGAAALRSSLSGEPGFEMLRSIHPDGMGVQMPCPQAPKIKLTPAVSGKGLRFIAVEQTFGTQELSRSSDKTMLRSPEPFILAHPADAESLGLAPGSTVSASANGTIVTGTLTTSEQAARGVAIAPRLSGMESEALAGKLVELRAADE